jgi:hypothetical protein
MIAFLKDFKSFIEISLACSIVLISSIVALSRIPATSASNLVLAPLGVLSAKAYLPVGCSTLNMMEALSYVALSPFYMAYYLFQCKIH